MAKKQLTNKNTKKNITRHPVKKTKRKIPVEEKIKETEIEEEIELVPNSDDDNIVIMDEDIVHEDEDADEHVKKAPTSEKNKKRLKKQIIEWMLLDDRIKEANNRIKKHKDNKKEMEEIIIEMIGKFGIGDDKMDINDDNTGEYKGRVSRYKSITKGPIKEDIIRKSLMEIIGDEKKVEQLVQKIDSKRPITTKYRLKRTRGNQ